MVGEMSDDISRELAATIDVLCAIKAFEEEMGHHVDKLKHALQVSTRRVQDLELAKAKELAIALAEGRMIQKAICWESGSDAGDAATDVEKGMTDSVISASHADIHYRHCLGGKGDRVHPR